MCVLLGIGFGLAFTSADGPGADQNDCGTADTSILKYAIHPARSGKVQFLIDDSASLAMYDKSEKLGKKYEFRIWVRPGRLDPNTFRVDITTSNRAGVVSCTAPQTLVYTAAEPTSAGCCGNQTQCKPIQERDGGVLKTTCTYDCECLDALCKCSHLVIRFYYVPWLGESQLSGSLYSLVGI